MPSNLIPQKKIYYNRIQESLDYINNTKYNTKSYSIINKKNCYVKPTLRTVINLNRIIKYIQKTHMRNYRSTEYFIKLLLFHNFN